MHSEDKPCRDDKEGLLILENKPGNFEDFEKYVIIITQFQKYCRQNTIPIGCSKRRYTTVHKYISGISYRII